MGSNKSGRPGQSNFQEPPSPTSSPIVSSIRRRDRIRLDLPAAPVWYSALRVAFEGGSTRVREADSLSQLPGALRSGTPWRWQSSQRTQWMLLGLSEERKVVSIFSTSNPQLDILG